MGEKILLVLARAARRSGGDRYETVVEEGSGDRPMVIYIPQDISRPKGGAPVPAFIMELKPLVDQAIIEETRDKLSVGA